jgi:peptide/nickel transport system permease protein
MFTVRRVALMIVSLYILVTVAFILVAVVPADPARTIAGPYATPAQLRAVRQQLGLNRPLLDRYFSYIGDLFQGNLGKSIYSNTTVTSLLAKYFPSTAELVILSIIVAAVLGLAFGAVSAYWHRGWQDKASSGTVSILQSLPDFILGVVLLYIFFSLAHLLPGPEGQLSISTVPPPPHSGAALLDSLIDGDWSAFGSAVTHAILPVLTLALVISAVFARVSRAAMREAFDSDQTKFARACGLSEWRVFRYALLTSRTPIMTYGAILFALGFGGTAIVETIFNWNGASQWAVGAMLTDDYTSVLGFVLVVGVITLATYFVLDLATAALDPRIRAGVH